MFIATHSGSFHADDVFAVAVLTEVEPGQLSVIRTRSPEDIARCTYAVDVGGEYDPTKGRFDHHQKGFAERRANGTPYAAAGLVWKHYGASYVAELQPALTAAQADMVARRIDLELVQHLDAIDTGYRSPADMPAALPEVIDAFNPTWRQLQGLSPELTCDMQDRRFAEAVDYMGKTLRLWVQRTADDVLAFEVVRQSEQLEDGRIVVLAVPGLPWYGVVCNEMPEARFVVYPDSSDQQYQVRVVPVNPSSFTARQDLPKDWAGLRDAELAEVSGVTDAVFCHNGLFIAGAKSKAGAIALATAALS